MRHIITQASVKLIERYLPDPYIFVILLTALVAVAAILLEGKAPIEVINIWGDGFWGLLTFTLQMMMVLLTGHMLANTPIVKKGLNYLSRLATSAPKAILLISFISLVASWINWGFGLVVGALLAKELARNVKVDYRLLVASAYSGFLIWHGGLSGSVPVTIATEKHFLESSMGLIPTSDTLFSSFNLVIVFGLLVIMPLFNRWMLPSDENSVYVDPKKLEDAPISNNEQDDQRPAAKLENSMILSLLIGLLGLTYVVYYFTVTQGGLNLNIINFTFLFLAILLHKTPRRLLNSLEEAIKGCSGIILQFPFYAGIMAIMQGSGLASTISVWIISFASADTLSFWTFMSAGLVNIFIPSGGGQWAVQGPIVIEAAKNLGVDLPHVAMAVAWGDAWTNMLQPFWALPVLAIAGLKAKDIMGFCLLQLIVSGIIISVGLSFF